MHPGINLDSTPLMRKNSAELLNNCTFSHIEYVNFSDTGVFSSAAFPRCLFAFFVYPHIFQAIRPFSTDDVRFCCSTDAPASPCRRISSPVPRPPSMRFLMIFSGRRSPPTRSIFIFTVPSGKLRHYRDSDHARQSLGRSTCRIPCISGEHARGSGKIRPRCPSALRSAHL